MTIPVSLLTGFLGSGKTTLLNQLLRDSRLNRTAVLVNEIGSIGVDHDLVIGGSDDMLLLDGGCLCCQPKGSIADALMEIIDFDRADSSERPVRVVIETSGAANPIPILETLALTPALRKRFHFAGVVTVIDALFGEETLASHTEARLQLASADCVVISKLDMGDENARARIMAAIDALNTSAVRCERNPEQLPDALVELLTRAETGTVAGAVPKFRPTETSTHETSFDTVALEFPGTLAPDEAQEWVGSLLERYGAHLLRAKGLLNLAGNDRQAVLQCVRDVVHPMHLAATTAPQTPNRIVLISRDIHPDLLQEQLDALARLAQHNQSQ